jgi:hypothetical protein
MSKGGPPSQARRRRDQRAATHARIEAEREALLRRLACLHPTSKAKPGYRSAEILLTSTYMRNKRAAREAILQAAQFMINILEMSPPT